MPKYFALLCLFLLPFSTWAQDPHSDVSDSTAAENIAQQPSSQHQGMEHMQHGTEGMHMQPQSLTQQTLLHGSAGTSAEPNSTPVHMLMKNNWGWNWMFHGNAFVNFEQQSGSRGYDKVFSTNWFMPMVQRDLGPGQLTLRFMASLEPATVDGYYPLLFQTGEVAKGRPIVDGQHPHDFVMELAGLYDIKLGENSLLSFYAAPIGDPALGPSSYPHRASASENPVAALGHHQQDSTHIGSDVITVGLTHKQFRVEASGFHGREPDEHRWNIDPGPIDSWSTRLTVNPAQNWSAQYSIGGLHSPEQFHPDEDIRRMTASVMYNRPLARGNWASTIVWGRNRNLHDRSVFNGYLAESTLKFADRNFIWGRIENTDRANELLLGKNPVPPGFEEEPLARVQAYTLGYDREFKMIPYVNTAFGGQVSWYGVPRSLKPIYGDHPIGAVMFVRLRPSANHQ